MLDFKIRKKAFSRKSGIFIYFCPCGRSFAGRLISKNVEKTDFDPNAPGVNNGRYFGLPFTPEQARLVLMSVPWDVTTSYREGTAGGPDAILDASLAGRSVRPAQSGRLAAGNRDAAGRRYAGTAR